MTRRPTVLTVAILNTAPGRTLAPAPRRLRWDWVSHFLAGLALLGLIALVAS